jgi:histidinol dehydrogenase
VGINLFPDRKRCSFDCPYCEVFPFETDVRFTLETMEAALRSAILDAGERKIPVRDICFSGNGEPTMSSHFAEALGAAAELRNRLAREAQLVVITNGTGLLGREPSGNAPAMFDFLRTAALAPKTSLRIWLKLDAGTEAWYAAMDRSRVPHERLVSRIRDFAAAGAPFILQTRVCKINGRLPPPEEAAAWTALVTELVCTGGADAGTGGGLCGPRGVQIYGKVRPAPEDPLAEAVPAAVLEGRAALLRAALAEAGRAVPVEVYE